MSTINPNLHVVGDVKPYDSDPSQGWVELNEITKAFQETTSGTRLVAQKRTALVGGAVEDLKEMVNAWKKYGIPGRIVITERVHGDLPESFVKNARNLDAYAKVAGDTKIPCVLYGEQIYRFAKYDPSGEKNDTFVQHDNGEAIRTVLAAQRANTKVQNADKVTL